MYVKAHGNVINLKNNINIILLLTYTKKYVMINYGYSVWT